MCKILWLDVKKEIQIFLPFAIEMAVLSVFLEKKGLVPLGVKTKLLCHFKIRKSKTIVIGPKFKLQ